jgi:hypothetical protein
MRYLYILSDRGGSWPVLRTRPLPADAKGVGVRFVGVCDEDDLAQELFEAAQVLASRLGAFPEPAALSDPAPTTGDPSREP